MLERLLQVTQSYVEQMDAEHDWEFHDRFLLVREQCVAQIRHQQTQSMATTEHQHILQKILSYDERIIHRLSRLRDGVHEEYQAVRDAKRRQQSYENPSFATRGNFFDATQ